MSAAFEELDYQQTPLGELVLRRRRSVTLPGVDVYEVKLDGAFLMSSLVNASEKALAEVALDRVGARPCDVLVGGLGLGCTVEAALARPNVRRVEVVELLEPVIGWHERRLVPAAAGLMEDPRCTIEHGDFFERASRAGTGRYGAILLDIDHSPEALLDSRHGRFYERGGLQRLAGHLAPGGVFALWSADPPPDWLLGRLEALFPEVSSHPVVFDHPLLEHLA